MSQQCFAMAVVGAFLTFPPSDAAVHAAAQAKHSGTIAGVDLNAGTITLDEMGPWTGPGHGRVKRSIQLTEQTTTGRGGQLVATSIDVVRVTAAQHRASPVSSSGPSVIGDTLRWVGLGLKSER